MIFEIAKKYDVTTKASSVLGGVYKSLTHMASVNAATATLLSAEDVAGTHARILPQLPSGTPVDIKDMTFQVFETVDKERIVLADLWIESSSLVSNVTISINITDGGLNDVAAIQQSLNSLGLYEVTITTV